MPSTADMGGLRRPRRGLATQSRLEPGPGGRDTAAMASGTRFLPPGFDLGRPIAVIAGKGGGVAQERSAEEQAAFAASQADARAQAAAAQAEREARLAAQKAAAPAGEA